VVITLTEEPAHIAATPDTCRTMEGCGGAPRSALTRWLPENLLHGSSWHSLGRVCCESRAKC